MKQGIFMLALLTLIAGTLLADISWSGDVRVRPRLDQKFSDGEKTSSDLYYMYRARLNATVTLTDGYFAKLRLAGEGPSEHTGKLGDPSAGVSEYAAYFGFTQMEFGRKAENFGYSMGMLPIDAMGNPIYDLHYFPGTNSDIAAQITYMARTGGFRGWYKVAGNPLTVSAYINKDNTNYTLVNDSTETEIADRYSVSIDYVLNLGGLKLNPQLIKTVAEDGAAAPLTLGTGLSGLPMGLSAAAFYTTNSADATTAYSGLLARVKMVQKVGPGKISSWVDYSSISYDGVSQAKNSMYVWLGYVINIYKSEVGSLDIQPTWRFIDQKQDNVIKDFHRNKIELTIDMKFK